MTVINPNDEQGLISHNRHFAHVDIYQLIVIMIDDNILYLDDM